MLLPLPLCPTIPTKVPSFISKFIFSNTFGVLVLKANDIFSNFTFPETLGRGMFALSASLDS